MSMWLRQSTAVVVQFGPFLDKTNGVDLETTIAAATLDHLTTGIMISKNGGTLAVRNGTPTASAYDAHGMYKITLNTTDTNTLGTLRMVFTDAATHLPVWQDFMVVPANVWDSMFGTDKLQTDTAQLDGTAYATANNANQISIVDQVWDELMSGHIVSGSGGEVVGSLLALIGAPVSSLAADIAVIESQTDDIGVAGAGLTAITGVQLAADQAVNATKLGGAAVTATTSVTFPAASTVATTTGAVGSVTGAVGSVAGNVDGTVASVVTKTGYSLSATGIQAIWDALTSALTTAGSIGKLLVDNINASISSRMATTHINATAGAVDSVTLVATTTTNTDMRGTDSAALASVCTEARLSELDAGTAGKAANQIDIIQTDTTTDIPATIAVLNDISVADLLTTAMTESYNADGAAPTLAQALFLLISYLTERSVSGTTVTAKKLDGATTSATFTLNDGTSPTSITRAT